MSNSTLQQSAFTIKLEGDLKLNGVVKVVAEGLAKPVLIIAHGFRGSKDTGFWPEVSTWFAEHGFYTVIFNFARISAKEDQLGEEVVAVASTISQELSDLLSIVTHVQRGLLPQPELAAAQQINLLGHSRSGGSLIVFANEHPEIQSISIWNGGANPNRPGTDDQELSLQQWRILEDIKENEHRFDILKKFTLLSLPALIVQGDQDSERLLISNKRLQEHVPSQTYISIKDANHTFNVEEPYAGPTPQLKQAFDATIAFLPRPTK